MFMNGGSECSPLGLPCSGCTITELLVCLSLPGTSEVKVFALFKAVRMTEFGNEVFGAE